jgi:HPr kinase/phosphorylase
MTPRTASIHATCVRIGSAGKAFGAPQQAGILLLGKSGSGKSDLALRLIAAGAELVADDRVELFVEGKRLHARAPARIAGLIEAHGIGIFEIPYTDETRIALAVELTGAVERLPRHRRYSPAALGLPLAARPPLTRILAREASAPAKVAAAVAAFEHEAFRSAVKPG